MDGGGAGQALGEVIDEPAALAEEAAAERRVVGNGGDELIEAGQQIEGDPGG